MDFAYNLIAKASFWQRMWEVFSTPSLSLFLLIGSAILAVALLVLTVTRWGHARPITKCVILSVIAHILLLGYAYGTRMMFNHPVAEKPEPVRVNLIEYEFDDEIEEAEEPDEKIVDDFASDILQTETDSLRRPVPDSPFEMERVFENESVSTEIINSRLAPIDIAQVEMETPNYRVDVSDLNPDEFEPVPQHTDPLELEPAEVEFQRRGEGEGDVRDFTPVIEPAADPLEAADQLQVVDLNPKLIDNNSFPSKDQRTSQFESELVLPDGKDSLVDDFAQSTGIDPSVENQQTTGDEDSQPKLDQDQLLKSANETRRLGDGKSMPVIYRLRRISNRRTIAKLRGGSDQTEDAVETALRWLATTQKDDGSWCPAETGAGREGKVYGHDRGGCGSQSEMGITALATLAFLGAGQSHLEGDYQTVIQKSLEYLVRHQAIDGDLSGQAKLYARMYCHSMSLLAISEALAMTGDQRLKPAVQLGVNYTIAVQDKTGGGWRYQAGDRGDMSQFGWIVLALHSARHGGIKVGDATHRRMLHFLKSCRTGKARGLASYRPGEGPSTTMTAEALLCTYFLGAPLDPDAFAEANERIMTELPRTSNTNLYFWYYATLALNQQQDANWTRWNQALQRALLSSQERSGELAGSWPPEGLWAGYGGRVYSTAMATLNLQSYYRYLPANEIKEGHASQIQRKSAQEIVR